MTELDTMHAFANLNAASVAHAEFGGVLLVLDNGKYQVCAFCRNNRAEGEASMIAQLEMAI